MRKCMKIKRLCGNGRPSRDWVKDRAIITVVLLAVTIVLLLIGFSGPSVYFVLPGPAGWLYIGVVVIAATVALVWLFWVHDKRKRGDLSGLRTVNRRSKRIPLR
jgi:protein-S-isoprenylcysteine O-methyltransferase Ste14